MRCLARAGQVEQGRGQPTCWWAFPPVLAKEALCSLCSAMASAFSLPAISASSIAVSRASSLSTALTGRFGDKGPQEGLDSPPREAAASACFRLTGALADLLEPLPVDGLSG